MEKIHEYNCGSKGCSNETAMIRFDHEKGLFLLKTPFWKNTYDVEELAKEILEINNGNLNEKVYYGTAGPYYNRFKSSLMGKFLISGKTSRDLEKILPEAGIGIIGELINPAFDLSLELEARGGICIECNTSYCEDHLEVRGHHDSEGYWNQLECSKGHCLEYGTKA